ncbi:hypothetical protein [Paraburkholderia sp. MM5384-R2]|uniref:hypothetical protein n=1 Tax=Paraburkholderia sp. MM5384-R2 TaxID=2723097 RepID=UPI0016155BAA|nr:hypothetical protein [Paraburkholderia sp. MM5384-R2]MBB5503117.1 hypothetical protein [Paraburkholderia sp. MM5384-R2]
MRALSGERLLEAWEQGRSEPAVLRAIALLAAALPECGRPQLLHLSIAERNRLLLQLRRISFGPVLGGYAACTRCSAAMEFSLHVDAALESLDDMATPASVAWLEGGLSLNLRQANTTDLLALMHASGDEPAETLLLSRCLGFERGCDAAIEPACLPSVREHFEQLHAGSELRCALCCPQCAHEETWDLDVAHFVWTEARHAAQRLLTDIHTLALHYGWSESAIAAMSQPRRDAYLELLDA